jgi:hypothetical protein
MSIGRYILICFGLVIGISMALADCEFTKPETIIGKANVLKAVQFHKGKKNKCFPDRGVQLGKIEFQYEFPEGSYIQHQVIVFYDSASHCYLNGHEIDCSQIQPGAEIGDVRYFERDAKGHADRDVRGILNQLFLAQ